MSARVLIDFDPQHQLWAGQGRAYCSCGKWEGWYERRSPGRTMNEQLYEWVRIRERLKEGFYKHIQAVREPVRG